MVFSNSYSFNWCFDDGTGVPLSNTSAHNLTSSNKFTNLALNLKIIYYDFQKNTVKLYITKTQN